MEGRGVSVAGWSGAGITGRQASRQAGRQVAVRQSTVVETESRLRVHGGRH